MSNIIKIKEERNILSFDCDNIDIVANSTNFYLQFTFDEEWLESSIFTVVFDFDGRKEYVELDEEYKCQIPPTCSSKIFFCVTTEPSANKKLSSTILSLNVEPSGDTDLTNTQTYQTAKSKLLKLIEDLETGDNIKANQANYATTSGSSETQVSLTGDEEISGVKNFTGTLQSNSEKVPNVMEICNPNYIDNSDFSFDERGNFYYVRQGVDIYTCDRWGLFNGDGTFYAESKTLTGTDENAPTILCQWVDNAIYILYGKTITVSATINGVRHSKTMEILPYKSYDEDCIINIYETDDYAFRVYVTRLKLGVQFLVNNNVSIVIREVKLELSDFATKYMPRTYIEERTAMQRYFQTVRVTTIGYGLNSTKIVFPISLPTKMANPTISVKTAPKIYKDGEKIEVSGYLAWQFPDNGIMLRVETTDVVVNGIYYLIGGVFYLDGEDY